ncbi:MAG: hypothetical protein K2X35_24575 [Bryobacteraceae bacterium]|nr:hypothetical protein [Bryobacteraceae bacterium]
MPAEAGAPAKKQSKKAVPATASGAARKAEAAVTHKHKKSGGDAAAAETAPRAPEETSLDIARLAYEIYLHRQSRGEFGTPEGDWAYAEEICRQTPGV